jgi:hypothetical protein
MSICCSFNSPNIHLSITISIETITRKKKKNPVKYIELQVLPQRALHVLQLVQNGVDASNNIVDEKSIIHDVVCTNLVSTPVQANSALELYQKHRSRRPIQSLNQKLDMILGGGVQRGEVTEFCGVPGMGKTQLA